MTNRRVQFCTRNPWIRTRHWECHVYSHRLIQRESGGGWKDNSHPSVGTNVPWWLQMDRSVRNVWKLLICTDYKVLILTKIERGIIYIISIITRTLGGPSEGIPLFSYGISKVAKISTVLTGRRQQKLYLHLNAYVCNEGVLHPSENLILASLDLLTSWWIFTVISGL